MKKPSINGLFFWLILVVFTTGLLYKFKSPDEQVKFDSAVWKTSGKDTNVRYTMAQDAARTINEGPIEIRKLLKLLGNPDTVSNQSYRYDLGVHWGSVTALTIQLNEQREVKSAAIERIR